MGFSGADIFIVLGEPNMLLTKLENPLLFLKGPEGFELCPSPENLFGLMVPFSDFGGVSSMRAEPAGLNVLEFRSAL
jgi:hypothetical protein